MNRFFWQILVGGMRWMLLEKDLDYRSLFDHNPDAVFTLDVEGAIIQVNKAVSAIFGYETGELMYKSYEAFIHPKCLEEVRYFFNEAIQGIGKEFEVSTFHKDQRLINVRVKTIPILIDGRVTGAYAIVTDITNFKRTVEELYKTEKMLEEFFTHTDDAVNILDLEGNVLQINPAFETMYGWKENEIIGTPLPNIPLERKMEPQDLINGIKQGETIKDFETTRIKKDGSHIEVNITYSPINDLNGNLMAIAGISRDITQKKRYEEELEFLAFHDPLTGLPNRRLFIETLEKQIIEETRYKRKFAVMYMDMDNFKIVNDTFGHDVGDNLLKQFALRIKCCLRETDVIARIGGDEFVVLLAEISGKQSAALVAQRILDRVNMPWKINNHEFTTTSSIGITMNRHNDNEKNLLKRADIALYQAKESGRNNYQFFL